MIQSQGTPRWHCSFGKVSRFLPAFFPTSWGRGSVIQVREQKHKSGHVMWISPMCRSAELGATRRINHQSTIAPKEDPDLACDVVGLLGQSEDVTNPRSAAYFNPQHPASSLHTSPSPTHTKSHASLPRFPRRALRVPNPRRRCPRPCPNPRAPRPAPHEHGLDLRNHR